MLLHFTRLLLSFFNAGIKRQHFKGFRNFHFTTSTKVSVLHDQVLNFFEENSLENKLKIEDYIDKIIHELKSDFARDSGKMQILDDLFYEMKSDQPNRKIILSMIGKL